MQFSRLSDLLQRSLQRQLAVWPTSLKGGPKEWRGGCPLMLFWPHSALADGDCVTIWA
jgi:hypothetical protein